MAQSHLDEVLDLRRAIRVALLHIPECDGRKMLVAVLEPPDSDAIDSIADALGDAMERRGS